jgi:hypothetical protein
MEKLYNLLFEAGDYTKSYEEFVEQYGDSKKSEQLYKGLNESGDYTKSFEEFKVQYEFNDSVKKKDSSKPIVQEEELVSGTEVVQPPGSSAGSEVIEEQIDFDETLPENQQILLDNQSNIDILNSVGFFDSNKPQMETLDAVKLLASQEKGVEKKYQIKDPETGEFSLKKESEIPENVLNAIKLYEKANPKAVKKEEVLLTEEDYNNPDTINQEILIENNVDQEDYLKWEKKNTRQEGSVYKFFKKLLPTDEGNQYELEKRQYEKLQSYNASKLNTITNKLSANEAAQSLSTNPQEIKLLKKEASLLKKEFMNTYSSLESAIESFPTYKDQTVDDELERRKELYNSFKKGGGAELSAGGIELLKTAGTAVTSFATDFAGGIPGMIDQRLATFGYDKKGFLAGVSEMITDSGDRADLELGELKRPAFLQGKPVTFEGEEFVVDGNGTVYDSNSNIRMEGILSEEKINSIIKRSKDVPNTVINWTGGSVATGGVNTIVNLVALIRTAGKVKNATGLDKVFKPNTAGKVSMGLTSFTSGVVKNVDDIRSQLMATGMSEKEAMDIAVNAGQAISTLDGIFSGLAGSNEGLLVGFQAIKDQVKNLAIKEGKKFTKKQLVDKGLALGKENMKELFVEELPVYFSEKGINYLVNQKIGNEVLDQKITAAGVIETGVMTIGATSTLGGRKLLTGNKRKDLVRTLATDVKDLKKTLDVLIDEGSLSKEEAANAYSEIYNMQAAELKTKGTIKMSQNVEEAADLLEQRQRLIGQKEGLEGPLKEEIDKRIEDVDAQIKKLQERDVAEAQSIIDGEKDGQRPVEVTKEEAIKALKAENEVRLKSKLPAILESEANILKKQEELIKDKQDAIQEKITLEELNKPDTFTHRTMSKDAITNWADGGQVIGKKEDLKDFDSRVPNNPLEAATKKEGFNRQSPNFQKGGVYSGKVKPGEFVVVTKGDNKFIPSASFQNRKTFEKSSGISTLKPDSRQLSNFDLYKVNEKGELIKQNWNNYKTNKDAIQKSSAKGVDVPKQTGDGQKVVKGDTTGAVTNQSQKETEGQTENQKKEVTSKERVIKIADDIVKKTKARNKKRGDKNNPKLEAKNAIEYLQQSKVFTDGSLSDSETEAIVVELNKKLGVDIKPPTVKKLLGIKRGDKPALIKVKNSFAAYKKQLKADEKLQSDQKKDVKEKRITLSNVLSELKKAGRISLSKFDALQKKINRVNLYNPRDVQSVTDYVEKVINDANAAKKIRDADVLRKRIKKDAKKSNLSDNVSIAAKEFAKIDPNMVDDIDTYLEQASVLLDGLKPTKITSKGVKVTRGVNIKNTNNYSGKELKSQQEKIYKVQRILFQQLTGLNSNEFTMDEMKRILGSLDTELQLSADAKLEKIAIKKNIVEKGLKNAFDKVKKDIQQIIDNAVDPLTGESSSLTKTEKNLARDFLNMDLSLIKDTKTKIEALDALINFATNKDTGGMDAVLRKYIGLKSMAEVNEKGYVSTALKSLFGGSEYIARWWNKNLGALPTTIEKMFNSPDKAKFVMRKMGFTSLVEGANKATTEANILIKDYAKKVKKLKMKSGIYFDEKNSIERGIFAEMRKTIPGSEQDIENEFKRSKDLIKESYEVLEKQDDKDLKREGKIIKEIYDKILKDSNNINEVQNKVDPANAYGVRYFTDIWASNYDQLAEVSLNIYNANLGKDINYTPTSYRRVSFEEVVPEIGARVFNPLEDKKSAYDEKTGVLKPVVRPKFLPSETKNSKKIVTRVLNLGFDQNNTNQLEKALTDIYTAPAIKQIEGARSSEYYDKIFPNPEDKILMDKRINLLVDKKRGVSDRVSPSDKRFLNRMNKIATFGVARVLGGVFQPIKQSIVLANAMIVGGPINVAKSLKLMMLNPEVEKAVMNSGQAIANRGLDAQADIETNSMKIKNQQSSNFEKGIEKLDDIGKWWLNNTLVKPDVFSARASWVGFYLQAMNKKGVKSNEIDWTQPLDKEAARDAQYELDRQQNVSDADLMGELFSSNKIGPQLIRKTIFPFATFLINQKNRMYSDVLTIKNPTSLPGETSKAARSLAGLAVETATFNVVGYQITQALAALAGSVFGEDEEEKEKRKGFQKIGRLGLAISDIASPVPLLDDQVIAVVNNIVSTLSSDENPVQFYQNEKTFIELMGTLGIGVAKGKNLYEMVKAGFSGKVTSEYRGVKTDKNITQEARGVMKTTSLLYFLYIMGYLPAETGYVTERILKQAKKEKQKEINYIPKKKTKKKTKKRTKPSGPKSPFSNRRSSGMPKSPF